MTTEELSSSKEDQMSDRRRKRLVGEIRNQMLTEYIQSILHQDREKETATAAGFRPQRWSLKPHGSSTPPMEEKGDLTPYKSSTKNGTTRCQQQMAGVLGHQSSSEGPMQRVASILHPSRERT